LIPCVTQEDWNWDVVFSGVMIPRTLQVDRRAAASTDERIPNRQLGEAREVTVGRP